MATPTKPQIRRGLILDPIHPKDYRELDIIHCCEQCSHFASGSQSCTIGYDAKKHLRATQIKNYELLGKVAFCRFTEID
jgi:hypothetical protein